MKLLTNHVLRDHVGFGGVAALILLPFTGWQWSLLFWLSNIFLDLDHYLHFLHVRPEKFFSVREMFRYHQDLFNNVHRRDFLAIEIFHTAEFLALLGCLSFRVWNWLQPVFWGTLFHIMVDFLHLARHGAAFKRVHSFVEYAIRRHVMKKEGLSPDWVMAGASKADKR